MIAWLLPVAFAVDDGSAISQQVRQRVERLEGVMNSMQDVTYRFRMVERLGDSMHDPVEMSVKFRKPFSLHLHYDGDVHNGRMVLYRQGWNDGRIRVRPSSWLPVMNLDPEGRLARQGQRHTIHEAGPMFVSRQIVQDARLTEAHPTAKASFEQSGTEVIDGRSAFCWTSTQPKDVIPELYAGKARICMDDQTGLPAVVVVWDLVDGEHVLVEDYRYFDIRLNVGLQDLDFDPENPDYNF